MLLIEILLVSLVLGLLPAFIAQGKGKSFFEWWMYGALLFLIALPHSLMMKADAEEIEQRKLNDGMKKCPFCAELIKSEAVVCRYCSKDLPEEVVSLIPCRYCNEPIPETATQCSKCNLWL